MTARILFALGVLAVVAVVAWMVERRRGAAARPALSGRDVPDALDRADFGAPDAAWLAVLFSSATCDSCDVMRDRVSALGADDVAVYEVEYGAGRAVHERYGISAVPTTVIVDREGTVRASWVGRATEPDLHAALDGLRSPG